MRDVIEIVKEKLLRKKEVAALLACSERTVDRLVAVGRLARVNILGGVRFRLSEVQSLMNGEEKVFDLTNDFSSPCFDLNKSMFMIYNKESFIRTISFKSKN